VVSVNGKKRPVRDSPTASFATARCDHCRHRIEEHAQPLDGADSAVPRHGAHDRVGSITKQGHQVVDCTLADSHVSVYEKQNVASGALRPDKTGV